jgi:hypothetical protein
VITEQKKLIREDLILPKLLSDNLSNVPEEIFLAKMTILWEKQKSCREKKIQ